MEAVKELAYMVGYRLRKKEIRSAEKEREEANHIRLIY